MSIPREEEVQNLLSDLLFCVNKANSAALALSVLTTTMATVLVYNTDEDLLDGAIEMSDHVLRNMVDTMLKIKKSANLYTQ
jgi:thermostable 8-oxoguanine DNA glycosylase